MDSSLDKAPCIYFASSDDGSLLEANETFRTILGFTRDELTGKKIDLFFPVATRIFFQTHFFPLLKMQGHASEIFITVQAKNREQLPLLINAERTTDSDQARIRFAGIVVHNRKKFEDELVAARKAAEMALRENTELQKMKEYLQQHAEQLEQNTRKALRQHEELMQFNRVVTHDLQEPLRKISIFSNMLGSESEKWQDTKTYIEKLTRSLGQMRSIVSGLQQYVWLTEAATDPVTMDLNELLAKVEQEVCKEFPDAQLQITADPLPQLLADAGQLHLLFFELLSNAVRFRKEGHPARLQLRSTLLQKNRFVAIKEKYRYQDHLRLQFTDEGIGFDAVYRDEVFRLFGRIHAQSGRGVGLALCKKVIENHHGSISIESNPGNGSTVTVFLPLQQ